MPPAIDRSPDLFMIPTNPDVSWATTMIAALIVLDVSTLVGEYHSAIKQSERWGKDARVERQVCRTVNVVAVQVATVGVALIVLSAMAVTHLTEGIDWRMTLVLEGVSRLEASQLMAYLSVKTPRWIGVYHSTEKDQCIQHVGEGLDALNFHVRYSIGQYFLLVFCFMLPFAGRPISALLGFALGFLVEFVISYARKGDGERQFTVASTTSLVVAIISSIMFADGCHYIQIVWGEGLYFSEWGLGIATFSAFFASVLLHHFLQLQSTVRMYYKEKRISLHEKRDKMALSLIRSHLFGSSSHGLSESQRAILKDAMEETACTKTTWSLFKQRLLSRSDLVMFSRAEYFVGVIVSLASLFVVIVNIMATRQMNVVRKNYHTVHNTLYGDMDAGPVCAFSEVGGTVRTFESSDAVENGWTIAHCGACANCSTWQDLRLQYTTRTYLAKESQRCAKKSFVYGRQAVHGCLMEEPIGFSDQCAECWTEDIYCARSHCAFIFIQANMINTVSNFQVGEDTITSATCEEANCELEFVPCSGANRRRMKITSTIARPGRQLCNIVGVEDWEQIFGEGGSYKNSVKGTHDELSGMRL